MRRSTARSCEPPAPRISLHAVHSHPTMKALQIAFCCYRAREILRVYQHM